MPKAKLKKFLILQPTAGLPRADNSQLNLMICPKCKKQIPDTSRQCQFCFHEINLAAQVPREISLRRYQRWFFYVLITIIIMGMIATIVKIYDVNSTLVTNMAIAQLDIKKKVDEIDLAKNEVNVTTSKLGELEKTLTEAQSEISAKTDSYKEILFEKGKLEEKYNTERNAKDDIAKNITKCEGKLEQTDAMVYAMIVTLGTGISNANLNKIPLADANFKGLDTDGDGLSDTIELALGTDKTKNDSDGDGFKDKAELLGNFNPNGKGTTTVDMKFADNQKGKILLQVESKGEAWYINPKDSKKYFLGRPAEALTLLANMK